MILNLIEDLTAKMKKEDYVIKSNIEDRDKNTNAANISRVICRAIICVC